MTTTPDKPIPEKPSRVSVLLPLPLDEPFAYRAPSPAPPPGTLVRVPFGPRKLVGVVWDGPVDRKVSEARLKSIEEVLPSPPLSEAMRRLVDEVADVTLASPGSVSRLALSVPAALEPGPVKTCYRAAASLAEADLDEKRAKVARALSGGAAFQATALARQAGVSQAVVKSMITGGLLETVLQDTDLMDESTPLAGLEDRRPKLTAAQDEAAEAIIGALEKPAPGFHLLEGVPGSGKTEVYHEAIAACLEAGRKVLILLPEIALSAQWLERFEQRFGFRPHAWHSGLTTARRRKTWKAVARGEVRVLVGARSALFLPFPDLGLMVMDEAHDTSFKQEDGVVYDARDVAERRCRLENALLLLVSATPSLESLARVEPDRHLRLEERFSSVPRPTIELVDLRKEKPPRGQFLGASLREALTATLEAGEQAMLFLNRRGYAPLTVCRACGFRFHCPNCTAWLTNHRLRSRLQCHHCGYSRPRPEHCPDCGAVEDLAVTGPGVERIAEELATLLPDARPLIMTSDTIHGTESAERLVDAVLNREVDVVIGTQLVAKGHHFPGLTLVGVVDADIGLGGGDLRATERTFQLLYQLAGRAGREDLPGRVLVQTREPDHPVMQALARADRESFVEAEMAEREEARMPPFGRLAALVLSGPDKAMVSESARRLAATAPDRDGVTVLGPAPAPLALLRGRYRERLLVKAELDIDLPALLRRWTARRPPGPPRPPAHRHRPAKLSLRCGRGHANSMPSCVELSQFAGDAALRP